MSPSDSTTLMIMSTGNEPATGASTTERSGAVAVTGFGIATTTASRHLLEPGHSRGDDSLLLKIANYNRSCGEGTGRRLFACSNGRRSSGTREPRESRNGCKYAIEWTTLWGGANKTRAASPASSDAPSPRVRHFHISRWRESRRSCAMKLYTRHKVYGT